MENSHLYWQKYLYVQYTIFIDHLMSNTAHLNLQQIPWLFSDFNKKI